MDKENDDASEFEHRVSSLRAELATFSKSISEHVRALHEGGLSAQVNLKCDHRHGLNVLKHEVVEMLETCSARSDYGEKHAPQLYECDGTVEVLRQVCLVGDLLSQCEDAIVGPDVLDACKLVMRLDTALEALPGPNNAAESAAGSGQVCTTLRREGGSIRHRFLSRLRRLLRHCVQFEHGSCLVTKRLHGIVKGEETILEGHISLEDIWTALASFPALSNECITGIVESAWICLLKPVWRERKGAPVPKTHVSEGGDRCEVYCESAGRDQSQRSPIGGGGGIVGGSGGGGDATSNVAQALSNQPGLPSVESLGPSRMPLPQLLDHLAALLSFLASHVLLSTEAKARAAVVLDASPIALLAVLADTALCLMPRTESDLSAFQRSLEKPCADFEAKLRKTFSGPTAAASGEGGALSASLQDLTSRFCEARRRETLGRARELLLADYHNSMLASGDAAGDDPASAGDVGDPRAMLEKSGASGMQALRFEPCQVSLAACRLLRLVLETLRQCEAASAAVAHALYQSARDCLELYMAVVPQRFGEVISGSPRMGAVFFNDCHYLAHNCVLLVHGYRALLGGSSAGPASASASSSKHAHLADSAGLTDFVPRLRSLGERCLQQHVEMQRQALRRLLADARLSPTGDTEGSGSVVNHGGLPSTSSASASAFASASAAPGIFALAERLGENLAARAVSSSAPSSSSSSSSSSAARLGFNDSGAAASVVKQLELVAGQWRHVLSDTAYERAVGHLLECVLRDAMAPLLSVRSPHPTTSPSSFSPLLFSPHLPFGFILLTYSFPLLYIDGLHHRNCCIGHCARLWRHPACQDAAASVWGRRRGQLLPATDRRQ